MGIHGVEDMYLADSAHTGLTKLSAKEGWLAQSIRVMDGSFTVEADKDTLVDVILGLYGFSIVCGKDEGGLQALINADKAAIFPKRYFDDLLTLMEKGLDGAHKKDEQPVFAPEDFEQILYASDAFSRIHGRELSRRLTERINKRPPIPEQATSDTRTGDAEAADGDGDANAVRVAAEAAATEAAAVPAVYV